MSARPRMLAAGLLVLALLASSTPVDAAMTDEQRRTVLEEAQAAYDRGATVLPRDPQAAHVAFEEAARRFQQLLDDGLENGALHYNLGNAYFQSGDLGRAILHYRQSERFRPGDPRMTHNLEHARSRRRNRIGPSGERALGRALLSLHRGTPLETRFLVFAGTWIVFWLLVAWLLRGGAGGFVRGAAVVCGVVAVVTGTSVAATGVHVESGQSGVVLQDEVVARKGNGDGFDPQFEERLHQGVEFRVLDRRGDWIQIELPDGKTGWVRRGLVGLIGERTQPGARAPGQARAQEGDPGIAEAPRDP